MSSHPSTKKPNFWIEAALDAYITAARAEELAIERAMIRIARSEAATDRGNAAITRFESSRDLFGSGDEPTAPGSINPGLVPTWTAVFAVGYAGPLKLRFS